MTDPAILRCADLFVARPWTFTVFRNEGGVWTSGVSEIRGVVSEGDSPTEAVEMARDALREWAIVQLEDGREIPEPFERQIPEEDR